MKKFAIILGILLFMVMIGVMYCVSVRNGLIDRDETVHSQWSQIETQLQRRADLIPNLVTTTKEYAKHEETVFTQLAEARQALLNAQGPAATSQAEDHLSAALGRLFALSESYPELRSNENFIRLQDELAGTENRISVARGRFNESVKEYNAAIRKFPGSLFAPGLHFSEAEYFQPSGGSEAVGDTPPIEF